MRSGSRGCLAAVILLASAQVAPAHAQNAAARHKSAHGKPSAVRAGKQPYYANTPYDIIPYRRMAVRPYVENFYASPQKWLGPGRDEPEPTVKTVRIGFLGPPTDSGPLATFGKQMRQGAMLAIERANAQGGYKGKPFDLLIHVDRARWGDSSNTMVKMACDEKVWGVLGTLDSANSHVMMRVTLKFPMPIVNPATTDQTLMEHRVPFILRVIPDDRQYSYATAHYLFEEKGYRNVMLIRPNNRDGRFAVRKLIDASRRLGHPIPEEVRFDDGESDFTEQLEHIRGFSPDAVAVWGNPHETALIVKQMRRMGMRQPVVGWFRSVEPEFLQLAGADAEGMVIACPYDPTSTDPVEQEFRARYEKRFGMVPDAFAAYAYDAMGALVTAIRKAGLNRVRIADQLVALNTFRGASGTLVFDGARNNVRRIYLAEVRHGRFVYRLAPNAVVKPPAVAIRSVGR
jgi:ABC-type branched-subunit amino acid transport system substrate-binding protein